MWGGAQGWNQWALQQPAMFNDIPHEQIDWAELAKQWIQMKQTPDPPPPLPPPLPPALPPPPGQEEFPEKIRITPSAPLLKTPVSALEVPEPFHVEGKPFLNEPGLDFKKDTFPTSGLFTEFHARENFTRPKKSAYLPKPPDNNFWGKPHWDENIPNNVEERLWNPIPPVVEPPVPMLGKETFDYGHVRDNPPIAMQSIDYNHMSEFSYNTVYPPPAPVPETHYDQYWSQINVAPTISPMFLKKERSSNHHIEDDTNQIDAAKRKTLPAWIRDGLEKMEQERLKRLEKEREAKENAEKAAKSAALKNESKDENSLIPSKSKFESDSEEGEPEEVVEKPSPPVEKRQPSPVEDLRTEEEKKQDLMLKVRRTLTEVLLSVTGSEMTAIAQDMLKKAMSKAPARQLASTTSLSSVASGLRGLASYGTESEASSAEGGSEGEESESDSEEELRRKIREKKRLFAAKEKIIIADLDEIEKVEKMQAERIANEKKSHKERTHAEKKDEASTDINKGDGIPPKTSSPENETLVTEPSSKSEDLKENKHEEAPSETKEKRKEVPEKSSKASAKRESVSSDSSSSSSDSESESSGKHKKKAHKETKKPKGEDTKRDSASSKKDKKSSKRDSRRKRSDSDDSRRGRSRDRKNKKKKSSKRSDSSSSSSDSSRRKSRKSESSRRNKSRDDRKRKRSESRSRRNKSDSRSSRSNNNKHEDEKRDRRHKEEKRHRERRRSSSPSRHRSSSSKVPRKYRSSRSLSSESESSGKKSKKSRNR